MGSPLLSIVANMIMQDLEEIAIQKLLQYYYSTSGMWMTSFQQLYQEVLMKYYKYLTLYVPDYITMEIGIDGKLSFLVTMIIDNRKIIFNRYQKVCSGRFFNFLSHYPPSHKKDVVFGFVNRIIRLSHPRFQDEIKNLVDAIHIFLNNGYPLSFIFSTIEKRLKFHIHNKHIIHNLRIREKFFTIPYVKSISESFSSIFNIFHCKLVFPITNTLKSFTYKERKRQIRTAF